MKDTQDINGDLTVERNLTVGGRTELRGPGRVKGNLIVEGWLEAKNIRGAAKGMFRTAKRLHTIYPRPSDGWWALVPKNEEEGAPTEVWIAEGGDWHNTGEVYSGITIAVDDYDRIHDELNERIEAAEERIDANSQALEDYDEKVENVKKYVDTFGAAISTNKVGLTALEKRVGKTESSIEDLQQSLEETNNVVEANAAGIAENRNRIATEKAARETAVSDLRSELESQYEELTEYADSAAEQAVETVKAQLKIYPFNGIAPTVNAVVSDGIFWIVTQSKFYQQGSPVYQSGGKADEQRVYSCGGRLYSVVEGVLTKYIRGDELSNAAAATEAKIEQKIETATDELRDEVSAYADESSEQAVKRLQSEIKVYGFDGIAPTLGSIAADYDGVMWVINEKQFFRKGTKVYLDTTGKPCEACLYSMGGRMYAVVGGDLRKFVREDEVTESIATVKDELEDEMEEKLDVLADEVYKYTDSQAEVAATEMQNRIGVYDFEGIYETAEDVTAPEDGAFYWIERPGVFLHGVAMGNVIELFEAFQHLTEGDLTERFLFRYNGNLYRVEDGTLRRYVTEREVEELEQKIETAIDELHGEVNEYADDAADGAISRAVAQAGIYPFDGLQGSIGSMPADGKIYWGSGENRFVSKKESGEPVYHYEPTAGYADPKSLYRCDNKLYKVTSWNQLVEFVDSDKLEEREQHLTTFAINVADEAVWRAKEELFADLWENYLTEWTPFGGVAGADNILPHLSLKIGGVEIDEEGNRRYKLFGFELTYEKALEVLAKPDPACFNGIGSINAYLSKFSNIAGALDLSIPRQPLQYFAGNFNSTFTQYGLRSIILPQITLQNITSSVALPEAILVYGVAFANVFAGCNYLRELYLLLPPQSLNLSSCPQLSEESVVRLIELSKAYNDTGINISTTLALHPDVYDALSDETFELAFSSQVSLVSTKKS